MGSRRPEARSLWPISTTTVREEAAAEVAAAGTTSVSLTGDVRSRQDVEGFVSRAAQELGGLDVLVTVVGGQLAFVAVDAAARDHR